MMPGSKGLNPHGAEQSVGIIIREYFDPDIIIT